MHRYGKTPNVFVRGDDNKLVLGKYSSATLKDLAGLDWTFTEKIDGTNIRLIISDEGIVDIRGRSDQAVLPPGLEDNIRAILPSAEELVKRELTGFTFYGEGFGPGIQNGGKYADQKSFRTFDILDRNGRWMNEADLYHLSKGLNLEQVPEVSWGPLWHGVQRVATGQKSAFGDFYAEGLIARPSGQPLLDRFGQRIQCKIKHVDLFIGRES